MKYTYPDILLGILASCFVACIIMGVLVLGRLVYLWW